MKINGFIFSVGELLAMAKKDDNQIKKVRQNETRYLINSGFCEGRVLLGLGFQILTAVYGLF